MVGSRLHTLLAFAFPLSMKTFAVHLVLTHTDGHPEKAFFENLKILGLSRQIVPKHVGAFWVYSAANYSPWF